MTYMLILKCALKLVEEIILYYDARSKKHQIGIRSPHAIVKLDIFPRPLWSSPTDHLNPQRIIISTLENVKLTYYYYYYYYYYGTNMCEPTELFVTINRTSN